MHMVRRRDDDGIESACLLEQPPPIGEALGMRIFLGCFAEMLRILIDIAKSYDFDIGAGSDGGVVGPTFAFHTDRGDPEPFVGPPHAGPTQGGQGRCSAGCEAMVKKSTPGKSLRCHDRPSFAR